MVYLCRSLFFDKAARLRPTNLFEKETSALVFSCEFCEIFKETFFMAVWLINRFDNKRPLSHFFKSSEELFLKRGVNLERRVKGNIKIWNSRATKLSYEIDICKMTSHFVLTWKILKKFFFRVTNSMS